MAKRKSDKVKRMQGTYRKDRERNFDKPEEPKNHKPPSWLKGDGRRLFKAVSPTLERQGVLTEMDLYSFAELCSLYGKIRLLEKQLADQGEVIPDEKGSLKKNPASTLAKQYRDQFIKLADQFGLTPESRGRLGISLKEPEEMGAIEKLMASRKGVG